jgi:pimeloyl-ACP methyl ester carboxylesterase
MPWSLSRRGLLAGTVGIAACDKAQPSKGAPEDELHTIMHAKTRANGVARSVQSELPMSKPSIVFVHGIWADGSSFAKVIPALQADGHEVMAVQNSLDTLQGDVDSVTRALARVSSPVILVGHSYGGTVITAAGNDPRVAGLVYIAALAPDETETSQSQQEKFPTTDVLHHIEVADGRVWLLPDAIRYFAGDLSEQEQKVLWATHNAPRADLFTQKTGSAAWKTKPSWYIVAKNDHTVQPDLERFVATRMRASVHEVESSHVAMLSSPAAVIDVIRGAAKAIQKGSAPRPAASVH